MKKKLLKILSIAPEFKRIMLKSSPLKQKKKETIHFLAFQLSKMSEKSPSLHPLEWILARDSVRAFRNVLEPRNEKKAQFDLIQYLDGLLKKKNSLPQPSEGFLCEMEHLLKGITGKSEVYAGKTPPSFLQHHGLKAARLRSEDLSATSKRVQTFTKRYVCGLEKSAVQRREKNKQRILKHFRATEREWNDWQWQIRHIIKDAKTLRSLIQLTKEEIQAVEKAGQIKIPFGITPHYLSLMDYEPSRKRDNAVRSQVIPPVSYVNTVAEVMESSAMDFMGEGDTSPIENITRRYPMICILKPFLTCPQICVYCQRNWEIKDVFSKSASVPKEKINQAIKWIADTPSLNEVLITGGDPLFLSDQRLLEILSQLARIKHIVRIRIGTRFFVTLPQRFKESFVKQIAQFHQPGKREVMFVTHFEHSYEITPESMEAVQKVRRCGMDVYNQLVFTTFTSRRFEAITLRQNLRLIGISPYYTFNAKGKEETKDYRVPIARLRQEQKEEARLFPGAVRTDEAVFNVPRLGKNHIRASQHHDVVAFLPDGSRLYEFHPWEKDVALVNTYFYKDVPIHDYLQRLQKMGENTSDYTSIWYYY